MAPPTPITPDASPTTPGACIKVLRTSIASHLILKSFSEYRNFRNRLESTKHKKFNLNADFPRKYRKTVIGIKITDNEREDRLRLLNGWMQELVARFTELCDESKVFFFYNGLTRVKLCQIVTHHYVMTHIIDSSGDIFELGRTYVADNM